MFVMYSTRLYVHGLKLLSLQGQTYTDAGATAYDAVDGALTNVITSGLSSVNSMLVGGKTKLFMSDHPCSHGVASPWRICYP